MSGKKVAIGIDLGTTKCCVGVVRDGKVEILENERSRKTTPSYVAFTDTERLFGEDAKDQATLNPINTIFVVKRLLGRQFDDSVVQEQVRRRLPFFVDKNERRKPRIDVTYKKQPITLFPEQVTAMLLAKMKKIAQTQLNSLIKEKSEKLAHDHLGSAVVGCVISVPASFSSAQRQATKDAATIAGLKVLALINEPTAAAIAYQINKKEEAEETIAVIDFGGGKLEASIVLVNKSAVKVKAVFGCTDFGGADIDSLIIELLIEKFWRRSQIKLSSDGKGVKARERLRGACEHLKHALSLLPEARVQLDCLSADTDFSEIITREEFEETVGPKTQKLLDQVYHELSSYVEKHGLVLGKVLLVGGSTRIPLVQRWLEKRFGSDKLDKTVNPDEAVAQGAALWAALLGGDHTVTDLKVGDVLRRAIVMEQDDSRQELFDQFAPVPAKKKLSIRSWYRPTECKLFETKSIIEDEPLQTLATFKCERMMSTLKLEFLVDQSGICSVSKTLDGKENQLNILILETLRLFQQEELTNLIEVEESFDRDTLNEQMRIAALSELESYCFNQKYHLEALLQRKEIPIDQFNDLFQCVDDMITWVDGSPSEPEKDYNQKQLELETRCLEFLPKDETAFSRILSSKRSSSANVSVQRERNDNLRDKKHISTGRKCRRDQNNDDSEPRPPRFHSHSAQRSGRKGGESPERAKKFIGTSDRESRRGRNVDQVNLQKRLSTRGVMDGRTRSLPRRDGSGGERAKPDSGEPKAATSRMSDEERVRNHASDCKLGVETMAGLKDSNQLVQNEDQRQDVVHRIDVGPPKIKRPLLPAGRHNTRLKNRSPRDQPDGDHETQVVSSHGPSHDDGFSGGYKTHTRDQAEVQPDSAFKKSEEESVFTTDRSKSGNNEFTAQSFSLLNHGKHSLNSREQPASVVRSNPVQKETVNRSPQPTEESESKQPETEKTWFSTEPGSCGGIADTCYGRSIDRLQYKTRSISVQTEGMSGQSITDDAEPGSQEILMVAVGKRSETNDFCYDCHEVKQCGCTIAASLASSNIINSKRNFSSNRVESSNSSYNPTKYVTQSKTQVARDAIQHISSSTVSTHGVHYDIGTYNTALTSSVLINDSPGTAHDKSRKREAIGRYRDTAMFASLTKSSSHVDHPYTLNPNKPEVNDDHRGLREAVGENRVGACVKSAMNDRGDTGVDSVLAIGSRSDSGMSIDRPGTTSSSIRTRSKSRTEDLLNNFYSLSIDPDCVCGSNKSYCSDCRSTRRLPRMDTLGTASAAPSSSVLVREVMTATSSGYNSDTNYIRKKSKDTLLDELLNYKCHCGSGRSTCADCVSKYILERPASSSGCTNARHLNPPGHSSIVASSYDRFPMHSQDSSDKTRAVDISRESSDLTSVSFHCVCHRRRTDDCDDCYLKRLRLRCRSNVY